MKEPKVKVKDRAKFPKVQDVYEKKFQKDYNDMINATMAEIGDMLKKKI